MLFPLHYLELIDASIGGKVAVNMPQGKNLVGAFHLPAKVYICGDFLTTLPEREWMSGKGEMLKYGFLSEAVHELIMKKAPIETIAAECAKYKNEVVARDFKENGERINLNLGHTLGHAFEFTLKIPHGQAVAMGMKYLFKIMKLTETSTQLDKMIKALNLPAEKLEIGNFPNFDVKAFTDYLEQDKKKQESKLRLVLVRSIGFCYVEEVSLKDFKTKIQSHAEFKN
jgi:3-dehydroquinate synthase